MNKYFLHGSLTAKAGEKEKLASILVKASQLLSDAPGCKLYAIGLSDSEENAVYITEIWDSKEDHDNSLKDANIQNLIKEAMPLIDGAPTQGQVLTIVGGKGIG